MYPTYCKGAGVGAQKYATLWVELAQDRVFRDRFLQRFDGRRTLGGPFFYDVYALLE
jgi:hypothetical protein